MDAFPDSRERRIEIAARQAKDAFFAILAASFPEVSTGDLPPDADRQFDAACLEGARRWVVGNWPTT